VTSPCIALASQGYGTVDLSFAAALASLGSDVQVAVELGSYVGYSTLRFARVLRKQAPSATLYSVDPNPLGHAIKLSFLQRAQLAGPQARDARTGTLHCGPHRMLVVLRIGVGALQCRGPYNTSK
jgi:hypothetical protein